MSDRLSFASWNVEHFYGRPERIDRVVGVIADHDPDIFCIFEVEGKPVYPAVREMLPEHRFTISEKTDRSGQEIMIGIRRSLFSFVTYRDEFRSKVPTLRPGALATIEVDGSPYVFLFLHPKSLTSPRDWGLRDDMFKHSTKLKRSLDKALPAVDEKANFLVLGDLNTMGFKAAFNPKSDLTSEEEIKFLMARMKRSGMRRLKKTHEASWWGGGSLPPTPLDHVFAANHLRFAPQPDAGSEAEVRAIGWPEFDDEAARLDWIEQHSDHAMLYGEILIG